MRERRRRNHDGGRDDAPDDDDDVDLDADEHAWWAQRDINDAPYIPDLRIRDEPEPEPEPEPRFDEYFSNESLFEFVDPDDLELDALEDPYRILGVEEGAPWEAIAASHRRLAMEHHPDRLLDATEETRERSERIMREINIAYSELRRRRGR